MIEALIVLLNAQAAQLNFVVGSHVWIEDPDEAWMDGEIVESKDDEITVSCESGMKVSLQEFFQNPCFIFVRFKWKYNI